MSDEPKLKDPSHPSGPVTVRDLKFHVDRDLCIGAATCVAIAPHTFVMDSEAKAIILDSAESDTNDTIIDAARGCPTAAIIVQDAKGNQIFP
ncbi:MAG: ferredoxin [Candidatus Roizmanbacteria bacterium]|nr:ferredoxin [Candidatus Roizmanbacteria bacterium]